MDGGPKPPVTLIITGETLRVPLATTAGAGERAPNRQGTPPWRRWWAPVGMAATLQRSAAPAPVGGVGVATATAAAAMPIRHGGAFPRRPSVSVASPIEKRQPVGMHRVAGGANGGDDPSSVW